MWRLSALLCAFFFCLNVHPAQASLTLCNQTSYILYSAVGWKDGTDNVTRGWARVVPGDCKPVLAQPLTASTYYLYARSSQAHSGDAHSWGGNVPMCVKDVDFNSRTSATAQTCPDDDAFAVPFSTVSTNGTQSWTTTLTEAGVIKSANQARDVGLTRLLVDLGYQFHNRLGFDQALARFRKRMKITPNADDNEVFDALETEAMKTASPAGYTVCNDTNGVVWAAIGLTKDSGAASAGWWKVSPGGCAHPLTQALHTEKLYLHAEGHGNPGLVSGPKKFCITNITFQTADQTNCKARGLSEGRFAAINTKGAAGFTSHVGNSGLEPEFQAVIPK